MISPDRISIVLPQTPAEIHAISGDIVDVARAFRRGEEDKPDSHYIEFLEWLETKPHVLTMAYVDGIPAGWIRIDDHEDNPDEVGRKCLEFSGAIVPEYQGQGLTEAVAPIAIAAAFNRRDAKKMIAVTDGSNPAAAAGLAVLGFKYRATDKDGNRVYRLMRTEYAQKV